MSVVHQTAPWTARSRARADHQRPAPLPSLKGAGRPDQMFRPLRNQNPSLLRRSNDSPKSLGESRERRAMSSEYVSGLDGEWSASRRGAVTFWRPAA
eukprot:1579625-Pyramimonas_sp.AAC.1